VHKSLIVAYASVLSAALIAGCTSNSNKGGSKTTPPATGTASSAAGSAAPSTVGSTIDAKALKQQVAAAMKAAAAFHVIGKETDDKGKRIAFDIHFGTHKTDGSITQNGQKIELINPGAAAVYFRLPDAIWRQFGGAAAVALLSGKWVKVPAGDKRFAELASSFDKDTFIAGMTSDSSDSSELRKVGTTNVDGTPATEYESSKGSEIYIAATSAPVILKIVDPSSAGGTLTFSDYGTPTRSHRHRPRRRSTSPS